MEAPKRRRYATPEQALEGRGVLDPETGCKVWAGSINKDGYGELKVRGRRSLAHRFSWETHVGPIPEGMHVDHMCHNRACVNRDHLRLATPQENSWNRSGADSDAASGHRNVSWHEDDQMWQVQVAKDGVNHFIGKYQDLERAAQAAEKARERLFGEFAGKG